MTAIDRIREHLRISGLDALLITSDSNRFFATGFNSSAGTCLITQRNAYFFTDSRYIEAAEEKIASCVVKLVDRNNTYYNRINEAIAAENITKLGFEDQRMTVSEYRDYSEKIKAELTAAGNCLESLRSVKTREELDVLIEAQRIAEKSFREILPIISTDITEKELAAELIYRFLRNGAEDVSFDPIVVSGRKSSMPHGVPGNEKISEGFLTMDFGVKWNGYCSDTTRTVCVGKPTDEMRRIYDTVLKAQLAGIAAAKAGVTGAEIDGAARKVISDAGYGEFFGHSFGHGLGIEIHEEPNASPSNTRPIPAGALISAEPGIYIPGKYGVRIEDVLYVTEDGCENITDLPKELICL